MGKKGSLLIPFLNEGLEKKKYGNCLKYVKGETNVFEINLPRKGKDLDPDSLNLMKDWYEIKKQIFNVNSYTKAKQRIHAALRKSEFVDKLVGDAPRYRILTSDQIALKKERLRKVRKLKEEYFSPSSVESIVSGNEKDSIDLEQHDNDMDSDLGQKLSDYDSGIESPPCLSPTLTPDSNNEISDMELMEVTSTSDTMDNVLSDEDLEFCMAYLNDVKFENNYFDDVLKESLLLENGNVNPSGTEFLNKGNGINEKIMVKVYTFKSQQRLNECTLLICEPKEEISISKDDSVNLYLDEDLVRKMSGHEILETYFMDNHLLISLKPQNNSSES